MKSTIKLLAISFIIFFLPGCAAKYSQVISVAPLPLNIETGGTVALKGTTYEYENADLKIRYSFWADHGIMGFIIYNKTDHPIYIDWKKSSMISGELQEKYYTDQTTSNFSTYGSSYGSSWLNAFGVSSFSSTSVTKGKETVVHNERITFISPKAYIANAFYNLTESISFEIDDANVEKTTIDNKPAYKSTSDYDVNFRNYLTYSDREDFVTEKHVDNGFKVTEVYSMKDKYFGKFKRKGKCIRTYFNNPTQFYITTDLKFKKLIQQ